MPTKSSNLRATQSSINLLPPGFYTYHTPADSPDQFRLHLRVEPDGEGILVVNAASVLHLNQTATEFAYYLIQGKDNIEIVDAMSERYSTSREVLMLDVQRFIDQILFLTHQKDLSPSANIGFEPHVFNKNLTAPLRIDCCLTYRDFTQNDNDLLAASELSTEDWKTILTRLYNAGIPQVIFFGGEPTLRSDLPELLTFNENLGVVSGLVSSDPKLKNPANLLPLLEAGLDHLTFSLDPTKPQDLEGLSNILDQDLFTCLRMPVHPDRDYHELLKSLQNAGINAFNLIPDDVLSHARASQLQQELSEFGTEFIDDMPLTYHSQSPEPYLQLWDPEAQASRQLVIQPDGALADNAGGHMNFGNLLTDEWSVVWEKVISGGSD